MITNTVLDSLDFDELAILLYIYADIASSRDYTSILRYIKWCTRGGIIQRLLSKQSQVQPEFYPIFNSLLKKLQNTSR